MPRLPSEADLGAAPAPRVSRSAIQYQHGDPTAVQRAQAKLGETITGVGDAYERINKELAKARQASQLTDAVGRATGELGELELGLQRDQDFKTSPKRFNEQADLVRQKYERLIDDPIVKEAFALRFRDLATTKRLNVLQSAAKQEGDYNVSMLDRNETIYATNAASAANSAERETVVDQYRIDLSNMRMRDWITDVEAGKRERSFLGKIDQAIVTRDMVANPGETALKLSLDAEYAANIPPDQREKLIDSAFRRADTERNQRDAVAERERKRIGDDFMKAAVTHQDAGTLTSDFVERIKPFIEWREYQGLKEGLKGRAKNDDPTTFSQIEGLVETNPTEARRQAFVQHRNGMITNQTLRSVNSRTRTIERQEGPRSPYERERGHITQILKPSEFVIDPAPAARYAIAIREFDDYAGAANRSEADLRTKADDVVKRYSLVDMAKLARDTGLGAQPTPEQQLVTIGRQALDLVQQKEAKKISESEFKRKMSALDRARKAAEKAQANGGR